MAASSSSTSATSNVGGASYVAGIEATGAWEATGSADGFEEGSAASHLKVTGFSN